MEGLLVGTFVGIFVDGDIVGVSEGDFEGACDGE